MQLGKKQMVVVSFMLFSLFFGAGNLIFPPFLGQNAGVETIPALIGFLITAVILPVLGVIVVAKFDGLQPLAAKVNGKFALVFTLMIYLSIGPGLGIPRAASVPFEMAVAPYLPAGSPLGLCMLAYSAVFFLVAAWIALNPTKIVDRVGNYLTPALITLLVVLFVAFLLKGETAVAPAQPLYQQNPFLVGFCDGYQTMDTIAALNFGLVIATTLGTLGLTGKKDVMRHTKLAGVLAGSILALIYVMLTYMGMQSSGVYEPLENGAQTLRQIVYQVFGDFGAILLAAIFTLACLTTCVGLINSISQYFSTLFKKVSYRNWVLLITLGSFLICNLGLNTILSISVPVLNAVYPVSIVLIVLGLSDNLFRDNPFVYPCTIVGTAVVSVLYALEGVGLSLGAVSAVFGKLPFYGAGFGWVSVAMVLFAVSLVLGAAKKSRVNA